MLGFKHVRKKYVNKWNEGDSIGARLIFTSGYLSSPYLRPWGNNLGGDNYANFRELRHAFLVTNWASHPNFASLCVVWPESDVSHICKRQSIDSDVACSFPSSPGGNFCYFSFHVREWNLDPGLSIRELRVKQENNIKKKKIYIYMYIFKANQNQNKQPKKQNKTEHNITTKTKINKQARKHWCIYVTD